MRRPRVNPTEIAVVFSETVIREERRRGDGDDPLASLAQDSRGCPDNLCQNDPTRWRFCRATTACVSIAIQPQSVVKSDPESGPMNGATP
jgi:hypothetical protein